MITVATFRVKDRNTVEGVGAPVSAKPFFGFAGMPQPVVSTGSPGATITAKPAIGYGSLPIPTPGVTSGGGSDWSTTNRPWAYSSTSQFTTDAAWAGATIVDIQTGSSDFYTNLANTVAAAGTRCVVRLQAGVYHLNQFRLIGGSGDPTYAFGFWFSNLRGFLGQGADQTIVQMDANSMSTAQINALQSMTPTSTNPGSPNQMGLCRFDGSAASPILIAGVKFRSADQQNVTSQAASSSPAMVVPQPAPHQGVVLYTAATSWISYCAFIGVGRASTSSPPFEMANLTSARGVHHIRNTEFDGRRDVALDAAQPRRCGPLMANNETEHHLVDVWFHHSNVSRYAVNDQNAATSGIYESTRTKSEHITDTQNVDPALNGGVSLGGWTNASSYGWETVSGTITVTDPIISVENSSVVNAFPAHLQLTQVGTRNSQGGRMHVRGGTFHHTAFSQLEGYLTFRIAVDTYWWTDGVATTIDVRRSDNTPMTGWNYTGTWPPSAAAIAAAGISPTTHYIYKGV